MFHSISVFIPAYNEVEHLLATFNTIERVRNNNKISPELVEYIIVDDGSTDGTSGIADIIAKTYSCVKVIHNERNRGLGYNLRVALNEATKDYFGLIPGDNETTYGTIDNIFKSIQSNNYDLYIPYQANPEVRPQFRRMLSRAYTAIFNKRFGLNLKYYNGLCFIKTSLLKKVEMMTDGPSYMAGIIIQLIKLFKATYLEIPMYVNPQPGRASRLLTWKNMARIGIHICRLKKKLLFTPSTV